MLSEVRVVRAYGRASTEEQLMSPKQQEDVCAEMFALYKKVRPAWKNAVWDGFYFDEATTRTSRMLEREVGGLVVAASRPGDVIMAAKYDRVFANVLDACEMIELMETKKFGLCILDMDIDLTSHIGQAFFKFMSVVKEMEVKEIRQRARDSAAYRRKYGLPNNRLAPIGWRIIDGPDGGRIYTEDEGHRRIARKLLAYRNQDLYRFQTLELFATAVNRLGLRHPSGRPWERRTVNRWLAAARNGFPKGMHDMDTSRELVVFSPVG